MYQHYRAPSSTQRAHYGSSKLRLSRLPEIARCVICSMMREVFLQCPILDGIRLVLAGLVASGRRSLSRWVICPPLTVLFWT